MEIRETSANQRTSMIKLDWRKVLAGAIIAALLAPFFLQHSPDFAKTYFKFQLEISCSLLQRVPFSVVPSCPKDRSKVPFLSSGAVSPVSAFSMFWD
jgi:hypothetical protein